MDADTYLLAFHDHNPGLTPRAFGGGRSDDGRSSYDILADNVAPGQTVCDLGCGDGYLLDLLVQRGAAPAQLIGVDMSPAELALARARPGLRGVALLCEQAQATSLPSASIDRVVSHLAFSLMSNSEQVVAEIARLLRPGGVFATIVGGGPRSGDAFELFLELLRDVCARAPAAAPRLGDIRTRRGEGLRALFHARSGFAEAIDVTDFALHLDGTADAVWNRLATIYELFVVPPSEVAALHKRFAVAVRALTRSDGTVPCTAAMRQVVCRRLGA